MYVSVYLNTAYAFERPLKLLHVVCPTALHAYLRRRNHLVENYDVVELRHEL